MPVNRGTPEVQGPPAVAAPQVGEEARGVGGVAEEGRKA